MKLVIDTNIIFSLFKSNSFTNSLLKNNFLNLYAPKESLAELEKYSNLICEKANITKDIFNETLSNLPEIIEFKEYGALFEKKADSLINDKKDIPFIALALELRIPIWSNDSDFDNIPGINAFSTAELVKFLSS